jgi:hypothetical protein
MAAKKNQPKAEEIKVPEVDILQTNDAKGMPEAGASIGVKNCCTIVNN